MEICDNVEIHADHESALAVHNIFNARPKIKSEHIL